MAGRPMSPDTLDNRKKIVKFFLSMHGSVTALNVATNALGGSKQEHQNAANNALRWLESRSAVARKGTKAPTGDKGRAQVLWEKTDTITSLAVELGVS